MPVTDQLIDLEHAAWEALSTDGETAADFYAENLAQDILMLLPGGMVIDDREAVIDSMRGAPWSSFEISEERILPLSQASAVVSYRATAVREDSDDYTALFNSTYVLEDGAWRLALHQQTPI
jgi:hypothetical protein